MNGKNIWKFLNRTHINSILKLKGYLEYDKVIDKPNCIVLSVGTRLQKKMRNGILIQILILQKWGFCKVPNSRGSSSLSRPLNPVRVRVNDQG